MDRSDEPPDDLRVRLEWPGLPDAPTDDDLGLDPRAPMPADRSTTQPGGFDTYARMAERPRHDPTEGDVAAEESAEVTDAEVDYSNDDWPGSATVGDGPQSSSRTTTSQQLVLAGRSDSLQAALASIALRIDALTSTTSTFRNLVSDRLTDYAEQVGRLATGAAGDLDDYRRLHERSMEQIRRSVGEAEDNLRKLSRTVGDLEQKTVALVAAVRDNGDAVDHLLAERDQASDTLVRSLDRVGIEVRAGVEHGLGETNASMARLEEAVAGLDEGRAGPSLEAVAEIVEALGDERERQLALSAQLDAGVVALADDRTQGADTIGRLEQAITALTAVTSTQDRGLTKLAMRIEARIDHLADALMELAGDDLAAVLTRLDARLKELSTDLVSGRDRDTAKALGRLSTQVDGLAGMISETRTERETAEARANRLARPAAAPVDLSELYARFDEMAGTLAEYAPPDLHDLHLHIDELGEMLSGRSTEVDSALTDVIGRLERLVSAPESAPVPRGRAAEAAAGADGRRELLEHLDQLGQELGGQIEALRRRIALRARPASPELDNQVIAAIADAVVARLGATEPPDRSPSAAPSRPGGVISGEQRRRGASRT